jgi:hypothetical protein
MEMMSQLLNAQWTINELAATHNSAHLVIFFRCGNS